MVRPTTCGSCAKEIPAPELPDISPDDPDAQTKMDEARKQVKCPICSQKVYPDLP